MHADLGILTPTVGPHRPPRPRSTTPTKNVKTPYSRAKDSMKQQPGTNPEALGPASLPNQDNPPGSSNPGAVDSWPGLKLLMRVLGSASGMLAPLKVVIDGFSDLVEVFECASADNDNYNELRKTLDALLEALSRYLSHGASQNMSMSMINLCTGIKSEIQLVEQMSKRRGLRRRLEAIENPGQVLECYQRIQGYLERLTLNANLSMWETVDRIEREARLRQLSPTNSAVYDSAKSEEIQRRACTAGTRESEIAKLLAWAYNNEGAGVYWMNGMAGTGKTTIAYSLCAELKTSGLLAASFFCSRLIPECRDVKLIIPAIAYQLARFSFPFWFALSKVLEADPDVHTRILKTQFERLLAEPLLEVKHTLPTHFIVVIDALDECDNENSIGQILDMLLSQTSTFRLPIRFLLSSRPEPQIYSRMTAEIGICHHTRLVLHELDEAKVRRDIEIYLKAELEDLGFTLTQLASLASHSGVLFIYASTAARYIKGGLRFKQHETRLSMILGLVPPSKNGKDRDIDTLYMSILTSAFGSRDLDESDQELMRTVVDAVVCAREPLTIAALAGLLGFEDPDVVEALLGPLRAVLNISENSGLVTILHASFPDFMCNRERSAPFHCDIQTTNDRIARDCFRVMAMNELQFNICGLESSHLLDRDVPDLDNRANRAIPMQLLYACHHWMTHLEIKGQHDPQRELMHEFLSKRLLVWMEVLNVKGSMHLGPGIMQRAEDWSRTHDCSQDTIDLAHDAWRFVTMYAGHSVSQSTPHIYVSMLPFWPESASVSKYYRNRMRGAIRAHGSAMTRRQLALLATWPFVDYIRSVCLSPDGTLIAYAMTSSVHVIDGTTGRAILGPLEHADEVNSISFSPDGALLVSGAEDKTVKVWRSIDGELAVGPLTGHTDLVSTVAFSPDGKCVFSGSRDGTVCIWSLETGRMVTAVPQSQDPRVWSISVSPDGSRIASAHNDGTIQVWSTESGQILLGPLTGHTKCIRSVCFSPDGMRLASGSDDHTIRLWSNLNDQIHADVLEGHTDLLCSVAFSPDGKQLVSGSVDDTVRLWDVEGTPQLARVFTGHTNVVYCVRFSSDGARIVSSSGDNTIRLWDARSQGLLDTPFQAHTQAVTSIAFSHDGSRIVSGSNDGIVYVWDKKSGQVAVGPMKGHTSWVNSVGLSPDESRIVSGSKDETLQLWDAYTGQAVGKPLTGHSGTAFSVCFSPNGALIASGSADTTIRLWDAKSGQPIGNPLMAHTGWVHSVCFSPDSLRLVSGSDDATILVWDVNSREPALRLKGHLSWVMAVCVSPDGNRIASGSNDTAVRLWDANDGRPVVGLLLGHTARVRSVCFSPNSSYVISGSEDKTIRLWDARSGQTVGSPFTGHTDLVRSVTFSPDGGQIVSGSGTDDCSIRVWDVADLVQPQESKDDDSKNTEPSHAYQSWVLQDDGWVVDPQSRLLAWVPPDLHASLMSPRNNLLILSKGSVKLELESAKLGDSWTECYEPAS